jgi:hypothetical protein
MARARSDTPAGNGELLSEPQYGEWATLARANAAAAASWDFELCGVPIEEARAEARRECLELAAGFSARLGVPVAKVGDVPELVVVTGHQPEIYHPGIWVKDFLLQRLADETGAAAIDLVVDSDGFDSVGVHSPCLSPEVRVCRSYLAVGTADGCFARSAVPPVADIELFRVSGAQQLATLPSPSIGRHFDRFCALLTEAAADAGDLGELVTFARRRYEAEAGTDYHELPVTSMAGSRSFARFVAHIALDAMRFAEVYNGALAAYRARTGTRTAAQPFPDLRVEGDLVELPLWHLDSGRTTVWVRTGERPGIIVDGETLVTLDDCDSAADTLARSSLKPAPKALLLTLFARTLVADLFIHGIGGGRYDRVTDDVMRGFFGIEPPGFAVASLTMYLPLGAPVVDERDIEEASAAIHRLAHNPDTVLDSVEFDSVEERARATALAAEKASLVAAIADPDADRKALGARIRAVNEELVAMLDSYRRQLTDELDRLKQLHEAVAVLTDRTYPFCFWSPSEIADKAR